MNISKHIITACFTLLPIIGVMAPRFFSLISVILGLIITVEYIVNYKKFPRINWDIMAFMGVLFTSAAASYFWSINPEDTIDRVIKIAIVIIPSLFLIFTLRTQEFPKITLLKYMPVSFIVAGFISLIEIYGDYPLYRLFRGLTADAVVAPAVINCAMVALSLLIWPVLYLLWTANKRNNLMIATIIAMACLPILSASCQSAIVAIILGMVTFIIAVKWPKPIIYIIGASLILGILLSPWIAQLLFDTPPEILISWTHANAAQRIELWDFVARRALEHPWYGWGIEATRNIHDFDSAQIFYTTTKVMHPHNFALQLWIELGVIGAFIGSAFIFTITKNILKFNNTNMAFLIAYFVSALIIDLVGYGMWQSWLMGLELITAAILLVLMKQNECHKPNTAANKVR